MLSRPVHLSFLPCTLLFGGIALCACNNGPAASHWDGGEAAGAEDTSGDTDSTGSESTDTGPLLDMGGDWTCVPGVSMPPNCGDGMRTQDEACDDGNHEDGDGCSSDCLCVEPGWQCPIPGEPCFQVVVCGDGVVVPPEPCDDGNLDDGDGCSQNCKVEQGWDCNGSPSDCTETTCGDGVQEGSEACDDGNNIPFDGCSSVCQVEPDCADNDGCTSECGDGLLIDEECDDGNNTDGDGCSSTCELEDGFECEEDDSCEQINGECVLRVPSIFRDFNASHSDFAVGCDGLETGGVQNLLDAQGKPVASSTPVCQSTNFSDWYTDVADNAVIVGDVVLFENGAGGFVNRWGPEGEQWVALENAVWAANTLEECEAMGCVPCPWDPSTGCWADEVAYDGQPFFFPVDDHPDALDDPRFQAKVGPAYGYDSWPWESELVPGAGTHNFHFTTEIVYWFEYDASASALLDFTGDDDVWVFVNGRLAVDLGGTHVPIAGAVTIDAASAGTYALTDGGVYKIVVFHAERKVDGSSFRLTLDGFSNTPSNCLGICGDGVVVLGEQCDDGINDGGYGECAPGCVLGEYCGDGIVQEEEEDCDDGNYINDDECPNSCTDLYIP